MGTWHCLCSLNLCQCDYWYDSLMNLGQHVKKVSGYKYPGVIVAVFFTTSGDVRYVVEATGEEYKGMLHIFSGVQLEVV